MTNKQQIVRHPSAEFAPHSDRRTGVTAQPGAARELGYWKLISLIKELVNEHIEAKAAVLPR